uniref:BED-type domain-containing protein n=1 Tax=Panagrolaimus davidi TaxID=227884 RepID=A0A914PYZ5_9BILA
MCRHCKKKIDSSQNGTTSFIYHLKNYHSALYKESEQKAKSESENPKPPENIKQKMEESNPTTTTQL